MRIGHGYDVHKFVLERKLVLGGVTIPYKKGLLGHSDADVLTHAIIDALLGAAALGDIGRCFPNTDKQYENICSIELLKKVGKLICDNGYAINNIDATVVAQKPKLVPFMPQMIEIISTALSIDKGAVSIKATTTEGLGFTGTGEGIEAHAVCLITKK